MKKLINFKRILYFLFFVAGAAIFQSCVAYNPYSEQQVTVPDIVQMTKEGRSSKDIIKEIRHSHTYYTLKANELAKLRNEGVQDSVINYMEKTHLDAVRRDQSMADSYYGYGWPGMDYYGGFGYGWPYYGGGYGYGWGPTVIIRGHNEMGEHGEFHGGFHGGRADKR